MTHNTGIGDKIKNGVSSAFRLPALFVLIAILNLVLRLVIYYNTELFYFADYEAYLEGADRLIKGEQLYILKGNFVMTISYLGFFANNLLGSIDWFYIFNCILGTASSLLMAILAARLSGNFKAGIITLILSTLYTEFMVFSSVFYTPVLMIFLLSVFIWILYFYYTYEGKKAWLMLIPANLVFIITLLFKPELIFLVLFLILLSVFYRREGVLVKKNLLLGFTTLLFSIIIFSSPVMTREPDSIVSNSFIFFGHTDYGGDGGEGSFVYPENRERYWDNFYKWCDERGIADPKQIDVRNFQKDEIARYITNHPFKWAALQVKKFTRTFGVVPEGSSFKVLYTGLARGNIWLTSILVVMPVALIILLFIQVFSQYTIRSHTGQERGDPHTITHPHSGFMKVYFMLFIYYIVAICFFGQYQERYRMPVMVCFIIPLTAIFISGFSLERYLKRPWIFIRSIITLMVIIIWSGQAVKAASNTDRLEKALETTESKISVRDMD